jgi:uncharacterized membrane protein required for colicin V production
LNQKTEDLSNQIAFSKDSIDMLHSETIPKLSPDISDSFNKLNSKTILTLSQEISESTKSISKLNSEHIPNSTNELIISIDSIKQHLRHTSWNFLYVNEKSILF